MPSPNGFQQIIRYELHRRGVKGPGTASIIVKDNHAVLHWLWQGKECRVVLDRHYDRYMVGADFRHGLNDAIDQAFFGP